MEHTMEHYTPTPDLLAGRTILVTGAGDGLGKAAAVSFAEHGATVILLGKTQSKLEALYDEIVGKGLPEPVIHPMNLHTALEEEYKVLGDSILEQFGRLDGILHSAGVLGPRTPIQFYAAESWMKVMQVNVNAAFLLCKSLLPALQASPDASIAFTSSSVGRKGRAYWGGYSVSKFAVEGLMQVLADELRQTSAIRVNSIDPGATRTNMRKEAYPAEDPNTLVTPQERMGLYLFLMGPDSKVVTGQALHA